MYWRIYIYILQEKLSGAPSGVNVAPLGLPMEPVVPPPAPPVDTTPAAVPVVAEPAPAAVPVEGGLALPPEAPPAAVHSSEDGVIGVFDHIPVPVPVGEDIAEAPPAAVPVGEGVAEAPPAAVPVEEDIAEAPPAAVPVGEDIAEAPPAAVPVGAGVAEAPAAPVPVEEDIAEAPPAAVPVGEGVAEATPAAVPVEEDIAEAPPAAVPVGEGVAEAPPAAVPVEEDVIPLVDPPEGVSLGWVWHWLQSNWWHMFLWKKYLIKGGERSPQKVNMSKSWFKNNPTAQPHQEAMLDLRSYGDLCVLFQDSKRPMQKRVMEDAKRIFEISCRSRRLMSPKKKGGCKSPQ